MGIINNGIYLGKSSQNNATFKIKNINAFHSQCENRY